MVTIENGVEIYPAKDQKIHFFIYATQIAAGNTRYIAFCDLGIGSDASGASQDFRALPIGKNGVLRNLVVYTDVAPAGAETVTFTILINGVATALTAQIAAANTKAQDITNRVAVTAGQLMDIRVVTSAAAASVRVWGAVACNYAYGT